MHCHPSPTAKETIWLKFTTQCPIKHTQWPTSNQPQTDGNKIQAHKSCKTVSINENTKMTLSFCSTSHSHTDSDITHIQKKACNYSAQSGNWYAAMMALGRRTNYELFSTAVSWTRSCALSIPQWRESQELLEASQETKWPKDGAMAQLSISSSASLGHHLLSSSKPSLVKGVISFILAYFHNFFIPSPEFPVTRRTTTKTHTVNGVQ